MGTKIKQFKEQDAWSIIRQLDEDLYDSLPLVIRTIETEETQLMFKASLEETKKRFQYVLRNTNREALRIHAQRLYKLETIDMVAEYTAWLDAINAVLAWYDTPTTIEDLNALIVALRGASE